MAKTPTSHDPQDAALDELLSRSVLLDVSTDADVRAAIDALVRRTASAASSASSSPHDLALTDTDQLAPSRRRRRATRRWAVGGATAVVALAGISAAAALPHVQWRTWPGWTADATVIDGPGRCAQQGTKIYGYGGALDNDPTVIAARAYVQSLDLRDIDYSTQLQTLREQEALREQQQQPTSGTSSSRFQGGFTEDGLVWSAYNQAITAKVYEHLTEEGYDTTRISIEHRAEGCAADILR